MPSCLDRFSYICRQIPSVTRPPRFSLALPLSFSFSFPSPAGEKRGGTHALVDGIWCNEWKLHRSQILQIVSEIKELIRRPSWKALFLSA